MIAVGVAGLIVRSSTRAGRLMVCSHDAFHARHVGPGVKGIIGMHRFNICLVVVLSLSCSGVKTP